MKKILSRMLNFKTIFALILMVNIGVVWYHLNQKQGFHSDEQWSYAHANSANGAYLDIEIDSFYRVNDNIRQRLFNRWIDGNVLKDYLTVQKADKFSYQHIYHNLEVVEHPPLYFLFLHTISSFFPDVFSKWQAGILNLILFVLIYIALFQLSFLVLNDKRLALCTAAFWGFSEIGIDTVIFLRMYILQTLLMICLVYETLKMIKENAASPKQLFLVFLYSFLGIFTHYNAIFFSFFMAAVACFIFLKRRNYKLMFQYGGVMILSVLMLFLVFPSAYDVLLGSMRGKQVITNLLKSENNSDELISLFYNADIKLSVMLELIFEHFFAFGQTYYKIAVFSLIMCITLKIYLHHKLEDTTEAILSVTIFYVLYLIAMPYMYLFHSRYYMNLMPLIAVLIVLALTEILKGIGLNNKLTTLSIALLVIVNSVCSDFSKSPYAFKWNKAESDISAKIKDNEVFIDDGDRFIPLHSMVYYLANAKRVFITEDICTPKTIESIDKTPQPIVLTYASYIFSGSGKGEKNCLEKIGLNWVTKVCASQHCYNVWEKIRQYE